LAGPTTLLDIAALSGAINPALIKSIEVIDQVVDIVDSLSGIGDNVILYFDSIFPDGTFVIFDAEAAGAGDAALPDLTDPKIDLSGLTKNLAWLPGGLDSVIGDLAGDVAAGLNKMRPGGAASGGFKLPIIDDPSQIFGMLMGQPAVLVEFDMAPLEVNADFSAFFSIFGPLGVSINAEFKRVDRLLLRIRHAGRAGFRRQRFPQPGAAVQRLLRRRHGRHWQDRRRRSFSSTPACGRRRN
jgi:hypothetical protein